LGERVIGSGLETVTLAGQPPGSYLWAPSRGGGEGLNLSPWFFYHVPKCGGQTLFNAVRAPLQAMLQMIRNQTGAAVPGIARFDDEPIDAAALAARHALVVSHLPFGTHERFAGTFKLVTVLRDPVARVRSAYCYGCMRAGETPTAAGFAAFFRDPDNRNVAARQLSGQREAAAEADAEAARRALRDHFALFGTVERMADLCSAILSDYNLPNVLMENLNATLPEYRKAFPECDDEVRELNAADGALFEFARDHPRLGPETDGGGRETHPLTCLIRARQNEDEAAFTQIARPTAALAAKMDGSGGYPGSFAQLYEAL
jgi:hypothetical protein